MTTDGRPGSDADPGSADAAPGETTPDGVPIVVPTTCVEYTVRHLQASMQHTDSLADIRTSIDKAFANPDGVAPDTISWTEIESQAQIDRIQGKAGWDTYWPKLPDAPLVRAANAVPISWRTDVFDFVSGSSVKASDGKAGVSPDRFVTRVRLRHKPSGTEVMRIAHHAVAGIDSLTDNVAYRIETHAKDVTAFNARMLDSTLPVIGSGDFNTTTLRAKLKAENGGTQPYVYDVPASGGSHGSRLIDYIVRRQDDGNIYELTDVRFVNLAPSDHRGVRATYDYRPAPCE